MKQNRYQKIILRLSYIALQGVFLPLILKLDDATGTGYFWLFGLYELLVIGDALLALLLFGRDK